MFYVITAIVVIFCWLVLSNVVQTNERLKVTEYELTGRLAQLTEDVSYLTDKVEELSSDLRSISNDIDDLKPKKHHLDY